MGKTCGLPCALVLSAALDLFCCGIDDTTQSAAADETFSLAAPGRCKLPVVPDFSRCGGILGTFASSIHNCGQPDIFRDSTGTFDSSHGNCGRIPVDLQKFHCGLVCIYSGNALAADGMCLC